MKSEPKGPSIRKERATSHPENQDAVQSKKVEKLPPRTSRMNSRIRHTCHRDHPKTNSIVYTIE